MTTESKTAPTITPTVANHVLAHYGQGGYQAGSFTRQLIATIAAADMQNRAKLAGAFPDYTAAVIGMEYDPDGVAWLTKLAGGDSPVGCTNCRDTAGPFDPTTGLCEGCLPAGGAA